MQLFECCIDEVLEIESADEWFVMRIAVEGNVKRHERIDVAPLLRACTRAISTRRLQVFIPSNIHNPIQLLGA